MTLRLIPAAIAAALLLGATLSALPARAQPQPPSEDGPEPLAAEPAPEPAQPPRPTPREAAPAPDLTARLSEVLARPGGLISDTVAARAVATSHEIQAKQYAVEAAAAGVDQALASYFPELTFTARYTRLSDVGEPALFDGNASLVVDPTGTNGLLDGTEPLAGRPLSSMSFPQILNQYYLQAGLVVPVSDYFLRIHHGRAAAERATESARLNARATRLATATNARLAYYSWVRARLQQVVAEQSLAQAEEQHRATQVAFDVGRASRADVMAAEAQVANGELLVAQARRMAASTQDVVRTLMHRPGAKGFEIGEDVLSVSDRQLPQESVDALYAEAERQRLEPQALERSAAALERRRRAAAAAAYPRLGAFANAYYANPHPRIIPQQEEWRSSWDVGLQLTWTPNGILRSRPDQAQLAAQRAELTAERRALLDRVRAEVMDCYQARLEASVSVRSADRALAAAEEAYRVRRLLFDNGHATSLEVTEQEIRLLQARLQMINARVNLLTARVRLEHAVGRDVR